MNRRSTKSKLHKDALYALIGNLKAVNKYGPMDEGMDVCPENYAEVKL